ncbi:MAG: glycosyltransferase family 39 protein [Pseudomonadota bacterium]
MSIDRTIGSPKSSAAAGGAEIDLSVERAAFFVLLLTGALMRFTTIGMDSLWIDEGHTMAAADLSYAHLWSVPFDTHPPLHVTFVKLLMGITSTEMALRLPSAVFSTLTLLVVYALGRRLTGRMGALVVLAMTAFSYTLLVYANNGRNYAQLVFFLSLTCLAFQMMVDRLEAQKAWKDRGLLAWSAVYAISALAALYTHNAGVLYLFALNAMGCMLFVARDRMRAHPAILHLAATNAAALLLWLPWLSVMLGGAGAFNWLDQKSVPEAAFILAATLGPNKTGLIGPAIVFLALGTGVLQASTRPSWLAAMIWFHLAVLPLFIWSMGWVIQPVYMERTILPAIFGGALALAAFATRTRPQLAAAFATGLVLVISSISSLQYVKRSGSETALGAQLVQDWDGAMHTPSVDNASFVICDTFSLPVVHHYADDRPVVINSREGVWHLDLDGWREIYGQSIAVRIANEKAGALAGGVGTRQSWSDFAAEADKIAFLKPSIYCNDGEAGQIRDRLARAGYEPYSVRRYVGLKVEVFRPMGQETASLR